MIISIIIVIIVIVIVITIISIIIEQLPVRVESTWRIGIDCTNCVCLEHLHPPGSVHCTLSLQA